MIKKIEERIKKKQEERAKLIEEANLLHSRMQEMQSRLGSLNNSIIALNGALTELAEVHIELSRGGSPQTVRSDGPALTPSPKKKDENVTRVVEQSVDDKKKKNDEYQKMIKDAREAVLAERSKTVKTTLTADQVRKQLEDETDEQELPVEQEFPVEGNASPVGMRDPKNRIVVNENPSSNRNEEED